MVFRPRLTPVWMRIIRFTHNRDFMYVVSLGVVCMCVWVGGCGQQLADYGVGVPLLFTWMMH